MWYADEGASDESGVVVAEDVMMPRDVSVLFSIDAYRTMWALITSPKVLPASATFS